MRPAMIALLVLGGCGGDPALPAAGPVTVHTGSALLVAVDPEGDGVWQRLPTQGEVTIEMGARWLAASVCGDASSVDVSVRAYSADDGDEVTLPCRAPDGELVPVAATVTGVSPATVTIIDLGSYGGGFITDGTGTLYAYPGTWDLHAEGWLDGTPRVVIQRDVEVGAGASVAIDFAADGFAYEERSVSAVGGLGSTCATARLVLRDETFPSPPSGGSCDTVLVVPPAQLVDGDTQVVRASSSQAGFSVFADARVGEGAIEVGLPGPLDDAAVMLDGGLRGTWSTTETWEHAVLFARVSAGTSSWSWSFADREVDGAATSFPDLTGIPGWDPAWDVPTDVQVIAGVSLSRETAAGTEGAGHSQAIEP